MKIFETILVQIVLQIIKFEKTVKVAIRGGVVNKEQDVKKKKKIVQFKDAFSQKHMNN